MYNKADCLALGLPDRLGKGRHYYTWKQLMSSNGCRKRRRHTTLNHTLAYGKISRIRMLIVKCVRHIHMYGEICQAYTYVCVW